MDHPTLASLPRPQLDELARACRFPGAHPLAGADPSALPRWIVVEAVLLARWAERRATGGR